jgi:hypothetical protein
LNCSLTPWLGYGECARVHVQINSLGGGNRSGSPRQEEGENLGVRANTPSPVQEEPAKPSLTTASIMLGGLVGKAGAM